MASEINVEPPQGALLVIPFGDGRWQFEYPRIDPDTMEAFFEALEYWRGGDLAAAEEMYRDLIASYPEFIDVHHHLALVLSVTGREEEAFRVWKAVVAMGLAHLPEAVTKRRDLLSWMVLENRPFLRAYHALGLEWMARGELERALNMFMDMLAWNPNDNQGARALAIQCNFYLDRPEEALAVCDRYPDDGMDEVMYGRALALYQLGRRAEAKEALGEAIAYLPLVAQELVKRRHRKPKDLRPDRIIYGGADQAYYYWVEFGAFWKETPSALELVRECLERE